MKQPIAIAAAVVLGFSAQAQSLEDGIKMVQYERYESAKKILEPLAASNATANYYLGLSELGMENTAAAQADFNKFPDDAANMAGMARVAFANNNSAEGLRLAQAAADKAKKKDWQPIKFAADAINYGSTNTQQAIDLYKKALERNDNDDIRIALGDAFQKIQGGGGDAMNNYEKVTGRNPQNSLAYSRIGALWYAAHRYDSALVNYARAKEADPQNPLPYRDLATAYFYVGKYELAKENIAKYLELSDKSVDDQIMYANALYLSKDYPGAIKTAQDLLNSGIKKPGLYGILAYSSLEVNDSAAALDNIRTYLAVQDPKRLFPLDYITIGKIMMANNMEDSADYYFNKAIAADTAANKSDTYREIGEAFKDKKTKTAYAKAGEWYGKVAQSDPNAQLLDYYYWGFWSFYGGNVDVAQKAFTQMYAKDSTQPSATFWLGRVLAASDEEGKTGVAAPYLERWFAMDGKKDNNLVMQAAQYLALYYYNKGNKEKLNLYMDKIEAIDPNNSFLKQLKQSSAKAQGTSKAGTK